MAVNCSILEALRIVATDLLDVGDHVVQVVLGEIEDQLSLSHSCRSFPSLVRRSTLTCELGAACSCGPCYWPGVCRGWLSWRCDRVWPCLESPRWCSGAEKGRQKRQFTTARRRWEGPDRDIPRRLGRRVRSTSRAKSSAAAPLSMASAASRAQTAGRRAFRPERGPPPRWPRRCPAAGPGGRREHLADDRGALGRPGHFERRRGRRRAGRNRRASSGTAAAALGRPRSPRSDR